MKLIPVKASTDAPITEEEIKVLLAQGTEHGTFEEAEQDMVAGVFRLGDRRVMELMQPRGKVRSLDVEEDWAVNREVLRKSTFSRFPVIEGDLDRVVGVVHVKDLFLMLDSGKAIDLRSIATRPLMLPEGTPAFDALERFQESGQQMALIIDEHGSVEGIVTLTDLMEGVLGDMRGPGEGPRAKAFEREDGSWLVDGRLTIKEFVEEVGLKEIPGEEEGFTTVGGLVLAHLNRIPSPGDHFVVDGWRFEVLDMDANRVDKVLVSHSA